MTGNRRGFNARFWNGAGLLIFRKCHMIVTIMSHSCHNESICFAISMMERGG